MESDASEWAKSKRHSSSPRRDPVKMLECALQSVATLFGNGCCATGFIFQNWRRYYMLGPGHGGPQLGNATAKFRKGFSLTITCRGYTFIPDLAVFDMYIDETVPELVSSELGTASRLKPGDRCRIIGSPRGQKIETIAGTIVQVPKHLVNYHAGNIEYIEISADVQAGFSGSPVFDEKNAEVVGMVVRGRPGLTLATPIDEIRSELPRYIDNLNHLQHKC